MKPELQKNMLYILIPSTILVVLWIIFSVYNKSVTTTISTNQTQAIAPIAPVFPTGILNDLKKRQTIEPLFSVDATAQKTSSEEAGLTALPTPTPDNLTVSTSAGGLGGTP